ncbi:MAG TPA: hypothetical protein VFJ16_05905 [Longimicrobium sp.]|nr:hypothetical protein [Longimicrobium sp.]
MIDPELAQKAIRNYHANTPVEQKIEDLRRWSPKLAERLGVNDPDVLKRAARRPFRDFFTSFGKSVHRLFS